MLGVLENSVLGDMFESIIDTLMRVVEALLITTRKIESFVANLCNSHGSEKPLEPLSVQGALWDPV